MHLPSSLVRHLHPYYAMKFPLRLLCEKVFFFCILVKTVLFTLYLSLFRFKVTNWRHFAPCSPATTSCMLMCVMASCTTSWRSTANMVRKHPWYLFSCAPELNKIILYLASFLNKKSSHLYPVSCFFPAPSRKYLKKHSFQIPAMFVLFLLHKFLFVL